MTPSLLSLPATALALSVSLSTVERLVGRGDLPSIRIGRRRLVRPDDLAKWIEARGAESWTGQTCNPAYKVLSCRANRSPRAVVGRRGREPQEVGP